MTTRRNEIGGVIVPLVTPLTVEENVDTAALRAQVRRCTQAGVGALFAGGSAGAGPLLRGAQWQLMLETVLHEAGGATPVLAGIIATSTARAVDQIKVSRRLRCETIVVTPTFYIALQREEEILAHFRACREATDQDLVIYNIPSCTGCHIPLTALRKMAAAGWAVAIKESSGDADYFRELLRTCAETEVALLQGNETDIAWSLQAGAAGIVPVCANYDPALFVEVFEQSVQGGNADLAAAQARINALREVLLVGDHNWISGILWGLHSVGIGSGIPPMPLQVVSDERKRLIASLAAKTQGSAPNAAT